MKAAAKTNNLFTQVCRQRLGARIWELRRAGIRIKTQKVSVETRAGHRSEIARYVILKNAEG